MLMGCFADPDPPELLTSKLSGLRGWENRRGGLVQSVIRISGAERTVVENTGEAGVR